MNGGTLSAVYSQLYYQGVSGKICEAILPSKTTHSYRKLDIYPSDPRISGGN